MKVSCCIWGLPLPEADTVQRLSQMGFDGLDVRPSTLEVGARRDPTAMPLPVNCLAASFGLPEEAGLDQQDGLARTGAVAYTVRAIQEAAQLGARAVYLVPGTDASAAALRRYAAVLGPLSQRAQDHSMSLSLEHFPGLALPTVEATRAFVDEVDHPNLKVLVDIGHAQIEGITPAAAIEIAGDRLGYVHLNDNDGEGDLHLALLDGVLTQERLVDALQAIDRVGYDGPVSLELHPELTDPAVGLEKSLQIVRAASG